MHHNVQHCGLFLYVIFDCFDSTYFSMFSKRLGTSTSPITIESEIKDSPVKIIKGDKFRLAVSYQLHIQLL